MIYLRIQIQILYRASSAEPVADTTSTPLQKRSWWTSCPFIALSAVLVLYESIEDEKKNMLLTAAWADRCCFYSLNVQNL